MMFWVPVIFLCFGPDSCGFMYDVGTQSKQQCDRILANAMKSIVNDKKIIASYGICIKADAPTV